MRWVHSEWFVMRRVFYGTLSLAQLRYKRRHRLLATSTSNNGLQLFTKVKCYFQDDEGPLANMGILATRSLSDHTYLTSLYFYFFFSFWVLFLYNFWSRPLYSNMLLIWFLVIPWGPLYRWKSNLWQLAEFLLGGNSLVPHDLLKRSWLWKQMRDNQLTLSDMGPEVFSSERVLKSLPGGR